MTLPGFTPDEQSPFVVGSVASDSSLDEPFNTPRPYLDASPQPSPPPPPPPQPGALRRSTSAPYYPSLPSFLESLRRPSLGGSPLAAPLLAEQSPHRPHLSLSIEQPIDHSAHSSPQPRSSHRKSRSYSQQASPPALDASAASSLHDSPSPSVELSPMHRRLQARAARAMSVGSARPQLSRMHSPARSPYSPSPGVEAKEDSGRPPSKDVTDFGGAFDDWLVDDEASAQADEAATPPSLASAHYPSLGSIYRKPAIESSAFCPAFCPRPNRPRAYRCLGGVLRCAFFTLFFCAFLLFGVVLVVQFRGATLYSNAVCTHFNSSATAAAASPLPSLHSPPPSVIRTQTTLPRSRAYVVFWNVLNAFFGMFSVLRYGSESVLSAATARIRVPSSFVSSAPLYTPDYSGSPLLSLPLNHFRVVGSHNSYHLKSSFPIPAHQYAHAPLPAQLGDYSDGVRQVELDVHVLEGAGGSVLYHVQLLDDHTNCYCLSECLQLVRQWSLAYARHYPLMLMIEFKRQAYEDLLVGLNGLTCNDLYNFEAALLDAFPPGSFLLPRDVRGSFPDVRSALAYRAYLDRATNRWNNTAPAARPNASEDAAMAPLARYAATNVSYGWPSLGAMLGRVMFVWLDDVFNYADRLPCVRDDPSSQHAALFVAQSKWNRTYDGVHVIRVPLAEWDPAEIRRAVEHGMLVRSLTTTAQVSRRDTRRYEAALSYGLHVLSSDFEAPCAGNVRRAANVTVGTAAGRNVSVTGWADENVERAFCERLPSGWPFECHPTQAPPWCVEELNRVRVEGLAAAGRLNASEAERMRAQRERVAAMGTDFLGMDAVMGR